MNVACDPQSFPITLRIKYFLLRIYRTIKQKFSKSNTYNHAKIELDILVKTVKNPIIKPFIPELLKLAEKFGKSGQSGGSAPFVASALSQAVEHLCMQQPICPITGHDDEWTNISDRSDKPMFQNKRCSAVFKDTLSNSSAYYIDAIRWIDTKGRGWSGSALLNGIRISDKQSIKEFPFTPKTFNVDVIDKEVKKDDWEFYVKDEKQLEPVFEYYNR